MTTAATLPRPLGQSRLAKLFLPVLTAAAAAVLICSCATSHPLRGPSLFPPGAVSPSLNDEGMRGPIREGVAGLTDAALRLVNFRGGIEDGELWAAATVFGFGPRLALGLVLPARPVAPDALIPSPADVGLLK